MSKRGERQADDQRSSSGGVTGARSEQGRGAGCDVFRCPLITLDWRCKVINTSTSSASQQGYSCGHMTVVNEDVHEKVYGEVERGR